MRRLLRDPTAVLGEAHGEPQAGSDMECGSCREGERLAGHPGGGRPAVGRASLVRYAAFRRQDSRFHPLRDAGPAVCEASDVALAQALMGMLAELGDIGTLGHWALVFGGRMSPRARPAWKECRRGQRAAFDDTAGRLHSVRTERIDEQPRCLTLDLPREWSARSCYLGDATIARCRGS